ncbi:hypothetical protein [Pyrobaculum sp.]|uniref:hypothetical protein n=1 Tax=Pyrobaculum sp. TaxID=2004705 RepID=UPI0031743A69
MSVYDVIGDLLLKLRFRYQVEEVEDASELAGLIKEQVEGEEKTYIYSPPGRPRPYLVSTMRRGEDVALAFLDLDDVREVKYGGDTEALEEASLVIPEEGVAPFLFPLKKSDDVVYAALGFKTVVNASLLTGGFLESLLEDFEQNSDYYFSLVKNKLEKGEN